MTEWGANPNPAPAPHLLACVVKAAGYQSASVTLGASGFQERKEVWGHPAPLPPFSSKQPGRADNSAVPPAAQAFGAAGRTRRPKRKISPHFLSHKSRSRCWGSSSRCQCCPALVRAVEQHHASAMPQFHPSASLLVRTGSHRAGFAPGLQWGFGKVLRNVFPAGLPRHKVGNPGARLNRDAVGQGGAMGSCCSCMPGSSPTTSRRTWSWGPENQQGMGSPTKLTGPRSGVEAGSDPLPPSCHAKRPRREQGLEPGACSTPIPRIIT